MRFKYATRGDRGFTPRLTAPYTENSIKGQKRYRRAYVDLSRGTIQNSFYGEYLREKFSNAARKKTRLFIVLLHIVSCI